jgi:hypothetical protein
MALMEAKSGAADVAEDGPRESDILRCLSDVVTDTAGGWDPLSLGAGLGAPHDSKKGELCRYSTVERIDNNRS